MNNTTTITATVVPSEKRLAFLPELFGPAFIVGEGAAYDYANALCAHYREASGYWEFVRLSSGGGYMRPSIAHRTVDVSVPLNGYRGSMTPDALGIVVTIYALSVAWSRTRQARLADEMDLLKDYADQHPEARQIFAAID